ncbi:TetR/AcrR family transcriptional regulator [Paenibacillus sp. MMS20-IR301]|uniref:TetR/AcrR family transcriptional regulator n=1 Tax=Paenibacillus sp. MMS20-IR301 TaxID=2895946 RepID=UPI0028E19EA4|nr:TetR/AcrR family transcriptional regulator [Paenibacillus sp. MMS20-IR301]WNS43948.1 TetR/AcrR family transcriptional regulator [Paenibacillus sp. MMS20-IR301]
MFDDILASQPAKRTAKQQRIVEAAIQLFAEKGYANTSTAEIAKTAEVSEASIFKQYGTKANLLLALIVPYIKEFFPAIAQETFEMVTSTAGPTFEGFLRELLKNRIAFIMENKEIFQVLIKEILYKEDLKAELIPYVTDIVKSRVEGSIELFKEKGELIDIPTDRILRLLYTFIGGFIASRFVLLNMEAISAEEIEDAVLFVMDGLRKS